MHSKPTQPKTSSGCSPSSGYNLTAKAVKDAEASKNLLNVASPSVQPALGSPLPLSAPLNPSNAAENLTLIASEAR